MLRVLISQGSVPHEVCRKGTGAREHSMRKALLRRGPWTPTSSSSLVLDSVLPLNISRFRFLCSQSWLDFKLFETGIYRVLHARYLKSDFKLLNSFFCLHRFLSPTQVLPATVHHTSNLLSSSSAM